MARQHLNVARFWLLVLVSLCICIALPRLARAQSQSQTPGIQITPAGSTVTRPTTSATSEALKPEQLDQLVAPIALYPDSLLAQVLMASTYPVEVVQAQRWVDQNKSLKGDALTKALEQKQWDPSIKSLVNFPQVLTMMSTELEWTTKLGDAFIADQAAVMNAVQNLRAKAQAEGNLKSNEQQTVTVQPTPPSQTVVVQGQTPPPQVITIESPNPQVVYVPTYNPTVVYGTWPYPAYPPPTYYPPGYVASNLVSFGAGVALGAAWGYAWGGCNWHGGDVDVDVNRNANFNQNINRQNYAANRSANRQGAAGTASRGTFQHDPAHRRGASYSNQAAAGRYGQFNSDAAKARDSYRGRADTGRQDIARGGADQFRTQNARPAGGTSARPDVGQRPSNAGGANAAARSNARPTPQANRSAPSQNRGDAFSGSSRSGAETRAASSRGQSSRSSAARSSGGSRSGGGGRAGGGRR